MYDIIIIGAGPAGSTLARLLAQDKNNLYKIALIDRRSLNLQTIKGPNKACGGLLSPAAQAMLGKLNLTVPLNIMESPQFFKVRTLDFDNQLERTYQRFYYNLDREKFDRYLFSLIPNSVQFYMSQLVKTINRQEDHWCITLGDKNATQLLGKFIVGADGANSLVRRSLQPPNLKTPKQYISIQKWYSSKDNQPYYTGIFDRDITDYYGWTIQKSDALIVGAAIPITEDAHAKYNLLAQKLSTYLGLDLTQPLKVEGAFIERSKSLKHLNFKLKGLNLALIGEASGATSPTSAEGYSYAMDTAQKLALALQEGLEGAELRYHKSCGSIRRNIAFKHLKSPGMYSVPIRKWVMKSGLTALE